MNLHHLSDELLDQEMVRSVKDETGSTLKVLHHLREVERRRLFSKLKYPSLLAYAETHLNYPYDQAWRRIQAMRLLKDMPEIESKIASGKLNLTNIGYAQAAFKAEAKKATPLLKEEKLEFLNQIESQSTRATQKLVAEKFGSDVLIRETVKPVSKTVSMLNLPVTDELLDKIERLKRKFSHSHPLMTTAELINYACDIVSEKLEKVSAPRKRQEQASPQNHNNQLVNATESEGLLEPTAVAASQVITAASRYIPVAEKRAILIRDNAQCTNCGSTYQLELDHKIPFAKRGSSTKENLRLLCRSCNQRAAIETYGINKMSQYLSEPVQRYCA
jgi:hypothetical protein